MAANQSFNTLNAKAQQAVIKYLERSKYAFSYLYNVRQILTSIDQAYYREQDFTTEHLRARIANRQGDSTRIQNVAVPIVLPQVEAFTAHMSSVFLTGNPIFGVVSSERYQDAAMQMEAILAKQSTKFQWKAELIKFFRNCGKYNLGACEVSWDSIVTPKLDTDVAFGTQGKPKHLVYEGNNFRNLDLYNTFWDVSVHPTNLATEGDFAGYNELLTRTQLMRRLDSLKYVLTDNLQAAYESATPTAGLVNSYYIPQLNPEALAQVQNTQLGIDWFSWAGAQQDDKIRYKGMYLLTTLYARIVPKEFNLKVPAHDKVQVWKFLVVNNSVLVYAERQTNAHDKLPIVMAVPLDDGVKYQTKGIGGNTIHTQQVASALMTSVLAARRRAVSDRGIYNPLYIDKEHISNSNPAAKIPLKPTAYGGVDMRNVYYQIPFSDDQSGILMQETRALMDMANDTTGQNKAAQGQFVKGNKTLHEYADIMGNANGRQQLAAIALEDQFFAPVKQICLVNILQYQGADELYHLDEQQDITIDPVVLRNAALEFKVSDGLVPTDKLINADSWQVALQVLGSSPSIAQEYNINKMFSYLMKVQGANVSEFEKAPEQIQYEQAVQQWQQLVLQILKQNPMATAQQLPPQPKPSDFSISPDGNAPSDNAPKPNLVETILYAADETRGQPSAQ